MTERNTFREGDPVRIKGEGRIGYVAADVVAGGSAVWVVLGDDDVEWFAADELERPLPN